MHCIVLVCVCVCHNYQFVMCVEIIFCPVILQNVVIWQWAHKYVILFEVALHDLSVL